MNSFEKERRSFLFSIGALGMSQALSQRMIGAEAAARQGYVLGTTEGEHLVHFRDHGNIFIKIGFATGSDNLAMGTQQVMVGTGIPIHQHFQMDEAFYVLEGSGVFILNDARTLLREAERYSSPKTLGMDLRIPITNCSYSGL